MYFGWLEPEILQKNRAENVRKRRCPNEMQPVVGYATGSLPLVRVMCLPTTLTATKAAREAHEQQNTDALI